MGGQAGELAEDFEKSESDIVSIEFQEKDWSSYYCLCCHMTYKKYAVTK